MLCGTRCDIVVPNLHAGGGCVDVGQGERALLYCLSGK